jgi:hypothetical protein
LGLPVVETKESEQVKEKLLPIRLGDEAERCCPEQPRRDIRGIGNQLVLEEGVEPSYPVKDAGF